MTDREHPGLGCVAIHRFIWSDIMFNPDAPRSVRLACFFRYSMCMLRGQAAVKGRLS